MNKIILVTDNSEQLAIYLQSNMDCQVDTFNDIYELNDAVRDVPMRASILVIKDEGMRNTRNLSSGMKDAGVRLLEVLTDPMFDVNRVVALNLDKNSMAKETFEFIKGSDKVNTPFDIVTQPNYTASLVKSILTKSNLAYDKPERTYAHVIRRKKGDEDVFHTRKLVGGETDKAIVLESSTMNLETEVVRQALKRNLGNEPLKPIETEIESTIEEINIEIGTEEKTEKKKLTKIVGVVGRPKTGTSTTSMILGTSASQTEKTLLIDMNYDNLGLSYLAEKVPVPDDIHRIIMSSVIKEGKAVEQLKEESYDRRKLHLIGMDLPSKKMINKEEFGFIMLNILSYLEENYSYIIIDIPMQEIENYKELVAKLDQIVLCTSPYITDIVPMIEDMKGKLNDLPIFNHLIGNELVNIKCLRTSVFSVVPERIVPIPREEIDKYSLSITGRKFPVTGIYEFSGSSFLDTTLYQQLIHIDSTQIHEENKIKQQMEENKRRNQVIERRSSDEVTLGGRFKKQDQSFEPAGTMKQPQQQPQQNNRPQQQQNNRPQQNRQQPQQQNRQPMKPQSQRTGNQQNPNMQQRNPNQQNPNMRPQQPQNINQQNPNMQQRNPNQQNPNMQQRNPNQPPINIQQIGGRKQER